MKNCKIKSNIKLKNFILIVITIAMLFMLASCRPTPSKPYITNVSGGLPEEIIIEPLKERQIRIIDAPEIWTEEMEKRNGAVLIKADNVEIKTPQTTNIPVLELAQADFTQERLNMLVNYFAKNKPLFKEFAPTKSQLSKEIKRIENKEGIYGAPFMLIDKNEELIKKMTETIFISPDTIQKEEINVEFATKENNWLVYVLDTQITEENTSKDYFKAQIEEADFSVYISARKYDEQSGTNSWFSYIRGDVFTESDINIEQERVDNYQSHIGTEMEQLEIIDKNWLNNSRQWVVDAKEKFNSMENDVSWYQNQAEKSLADLQIKDMRLATVEKGMQFSNKEFFLYNTPLCYSVKDGISLYSFTYYRQLDGLTSCVLNNGYVEVGSQSEVPVAPSFPAERITIYVSKEGTQGFYWDNMSNVVGNIAQNTKIFSFEEAKEKFADLLNFYTFPSNDTTTYEYVIKNAELRASTITAHGNPSNAWLIPVWIFEYDMHTIIDRNTDNSTDTTSDVIDLNHENIAMQINALNGNYAPTAVTSFSYSS